MEEGTLKILKKMTRTKLIDEAKKYSEIVGAHGMNKDQLIEALSNAMQESGNWIESKEEKEPKKVVKTKKKLSGKISLKKKIKEYKKKRDEALAANDRESFIKARAEIKKLKGYLRRKKVA